MGSKLVSAIICGYLGFLAVLLGWIFVEGLTTQGWSDSSTGAHSAVVAMAAMSGWFDKIFAILNFLFGLGGGYLTESQVKANAGTRTRTVMLSLTFVIAMLALIDLTWVAYHFDDLQTVLPPFQKGSLKVADAVAAIGIIHLGLVAGVLAGVGLRTQQS